MRKITAIMFLIMMGVACNGADKNVNVDALKWERATILQHEANLQAQFQADEKRRLEIEAVPEIKALIDAEIAKQKALQTQKTAPATAPAPAPVKK